MARVTVEDCLDNVDNRFHLVLVATKRARQLAMGKESELEWENDKPTVLALREIAEGLISPEILNESEQTIPLDEEMTGDEVAMVAANMEEVAGSVIETGAAVTAAPEGSEAGELVNEAPEESSEEAPKEE